MIVLTDRDFDTDWLRSRIDFPTGASLMQEIKRKLTLDRSTALLADSDILADSGAAKANVRPNSPDSIMTMASSRETVQFSLFGVASPLRRWVATLTAH